MTRLLIKIDYEYVGNNIHISENTAPHNTVGSVIMQTGLEWSLDTDEWEWLNGTDFDFSNWAGADGSGGTVESCIQ